MIRRRTERRVLTKKNQTKRFKNSKIDSEQQNLLDIDFA